MQTQSLPKYRIIYNDTREKIFSGEFPAGSVLPSESRYCISYNVSRETVRKALSRLEEEGLIFSRPKIGYFVGKPDHTEFRLVSPDSLNEHKTQYLEIRGIPADREVAAVLGIPEGKFVIKLSQLTYAQATRPILLEDKFLAYERAYPSVENEMRYAVFPDITLSKMGSFTVYTDVKVSARCADARVAEILQIREGDAVLYVERRFVQQDNRVLAMSRSYARQPDVSLTGFTGRIV